MALDPRLKRDAWDGLPENVSPRRSLADSALIWDSQRLVDHAEHSLDVVALRSERGAMVR
jgi:hypothetical protein